VSVPPVLTRSFALLVTAHFLQALGFSSLILLPVYLDHLGASRSEVGVVMGSAAVGGLLARPAVGYCLDRFGRKPTVLTGTAALVSGLVGIAAVREAGLVACLGQAVLGAGTAACFTGYFTLASDLVPESRRTEGLALFGISGMIPLLVNPLAGGLGLEGEQLRWFFPAIGCAVAASVPFLVAVPEPRAVRASGGPTWAGLRRVAGALRAPALWPVWLATAVFAGLVAVFMAYSTVVAAHRGLGNPTAMWLTYSVGAVSVRLFGASLPDRVGPARLVPPALLAYSAAVVVIAVAHSPAALLVAGALAGFGHGYCFPVLTAQTVTRVPAAVRGSALSLFTALWDVVKLALVPAAGVLADATDDATMLLAVAALALGGLAGWAVLEGRLAPVAGADAE
jgi:MFS family permease